MTNLKQEHIPTGPVKEAQLPGWTLCLWKRIVTAKAPICEGSLVSESVWMMMKSVMYTNTRTMLSNRSPRDLARSLFWARQDAHTFDIGHSRASQQARITCITNCVIISDVKVSVQETRTLCSSTVHGPYRIGACPTLLLACHALKPSVAEIPQSRRGARDHLAKHTGSSESSQTKPRHKL